jgi:hypothetical protein
MERADGRVPLLRYVVLYVRVRMLSPYLLFDVANTILQ